MPRLKRKDKRRPMAITPAQWAYLNDAEEWPPGTIMEWLALENDVSPLFKVRDLWAMHRDVVLADWAIRFPGTRPKLWWRFDAPPEPRLDSEPQANHLDRHGLLFPGERRRIPKQDSTK